jgi:hypothetical protein
MTPYGRRIAFALGCVATASSCKQPLPLAASSAKDAQTQAAAVALKHPGEASQRLYAFYTNPFSVMRAGDTLKWNREGTPIAQTEPPGEEEQRALLAQTEAVRDQYGIGVGSADGQRAGFDSSPQQEAFALVNPDAKRFDDYRLLFGAEKITTNVFEVTGPLANARVDTDADVWSDYFWALVHLGPAFRYREGKYKFPMYTTASGPGGAPRDETTLAQTHASLKHEPSDPQSFPKNPESIPKANYEEMSPAEKYDLLIGSKDFRFTHGVDRFISARNPPAWEGFCHGWSYASTVLPRPESAVRVRLEGGSELKFTPSDLKALATFHFGSLELKDTTRSVGALCRQYLGNEAYDNYGHILPNDPQNAPTPGSPRDRDACADLNPSSFFISVVNRVGGQKRPLIMDAAADASVWNHPIVGYRVAYFNPNGQTALSGDPKSVAINAADYQQFNYFKKYRQRAGSSHAFSKIVGVAMEVDYMAENWPQQGDTDAPALDLQNTALYLFDLELAEDGTIVGGEWYQNAHPDMVWMPVLRRLPLLEADKEVKSSWDIKSPLPDDWKKAALAQLDVPDADVAKAGAAFPASPPPF